MKLTKDTPLTRETMEYALRGIGRATGRPDLPIRIADALLWEIEQARLTRQATKH